MKLKTFYAARDIMERRDRLTARQEALRIPGSPIVVTVGGYLVPLTANTSDMVRTIALADVANQVKIFMMNWRDFSGYFQTNSQSR